MPPAPISTEEEATLIKAAFEAKKGSYSPYSKFRVGAALLTPEGEIIKGANIENASYGATICAERTALIKAVSEGKKTFAALAVTTDVAEAVSPCGICRQFIREFCALDMPIYIVPGDYYDEAGGVKNAAGVKKVTLNEILPFSFGPEHLELPRKG